MGLDYAIEEIAKLREKLAEAREQRTEEAVRRIAKSIHDVCQTSRPTCTQVAEAIASARIALVAVQLTRLPSPRAGDEPRCHCAARLLTGRRP